jgi:hypothetical protein
MKIVPFTITAIVLVLVLISAFSPDTPTETNGVRWARRCAIEAGPRAQDQKDCVFIKGTAFTLEKLDEEKRRRERWER